MVDSQSSYPTAKWYRVYSSPSENGEILWIEVDREGDFCIQKENGDVKRIRFKFKDTEALSYILQALDGFIQSSFTTAKEVKE